MQFREGTSLKVVWNAIGIKFPYHCIKQSTIQIQYSVQVLFTLLEVKQTQHLACVKLFANNIKNVC